jgi:hypothetical protein
MSEFYGMIKTIRNIPIWDKDGISAEWIKFYEVEIRDGATRKVVASMKTDEIKEATAFMDKFRLSNLDEALRKEDPDWYDPALFL